MFDILIWLPGHLAMKARPLVLSSNRQTKMNPGKLTLSVTFVLQPSEFPVVKQLNCLLSADYAHNVSMSDSEFGTNGSDRGKSPRRPHRWALKKNCRGEILFFLISQLLSFQTSLCPAVICPFPNTQPGDNHSMSVPLVSPVGNGTLFEQWWSKTNTVPLYLIVLLLPLLCFRSASFFARFTFLGTKPPATVCYLSCQL